ncbi:Anaerobic dimethyl sulfoxide reductasechaperone DmsD [Salmonella enterica subsp. enterica]|uniref:Anaerobic dimethyl sulfoxide reductasechaperone DmsD n=1 Tax=Salmonella enterica I TaxID=59201 RepID=A0A447MT26_SALET|nr:Anaerobic dimethyl sulfoxide reductasechaperone DmsD [Salmonella enterica subsp. enterica]
MQQNEPEDHFGSLLLLAAWLAENDRHHECEQLLAWHLFPWSSRFLDVFIDHAGHPFYQALGQLARLTLAQWQAQLIIPRRCKTVIPLIPTKGRILPAFSPIAAYFYLQKSDNVTPRFYF